MKTNKMDRPYESAALRAVTGPTIRPGGLALTHRAVEVCGLGSGARVLDVGCGTGATAACLEDHHDASVVGMDLSSTLLSDAIRHYPEMAAVRADAMVLPFTAGAFDAVFAECVCSLLPDAAAAIEGFFRILRPGGHLVVADLYWRTWNSAAIRPKVSFYGCLAGAVDRHTMIRRIETAGFKIHLWEDHSDFLKQLAAQLVWAGIPLSNWLDGDCASRTCRYGRRPGYCVIVARKKEKTHG